MNVLTLLAALFTTQVNINNAKVTATGSSTARPLKDWAADIGTTTAPLPQNKGGTGVGVLGDGTVTATGSTTARALKDRAADVINVKDYGAKGDGVTDDTSSIAAAAVAAYGAPQGGAIFFPRGSYKVTSTIVLTNISVRGAGAYGTVITGNLPNVAIFDFSGTAAEMADVTVTNSGAAGIGIRVGATLGIGLTIRDVLVSVAGANGIGIKKELGFSLTVLGVRFVASAAGAIGIEGGSHMTIVNPDVVGFAEGLRIWGTGVSVLGGRYEVNVIGVRAGYNDTLGYEPLTGSLIAGLRMEACDTFMILNLGGAATVRDVAFQGSTNAPSGQSQYGIRVLQMQGSHLGPAGIGGTYSKAGLSVEGPVTGSVLEGVVASPTLPGSVGTDWRVPLLDSPYSTFLNSSLDVTGNISSTPVTSLLGSPLTVGLSSLSLIAGNKQARNLRGTNVPVGAAVVSIAVAFPTARSNGGAQIASFTPGSGGTLAAGTYYYASGFLSEIAEGTFAEQSYSLVGPNNSITLGFYGGYAAPWLRRRVYRGAAPGVYDGYYDLPVNSDAAFVDTGAAFTGKKNPPASGAGVTAQAEPDANYAITCTPQWNATCWVTGKATTGFTLNFSAAPGGTGSFVDWHLIR